MIKFYIPSYTEHYLELLNFLFDEDVELCLSARQADIIIDKPGNLHKYPKKYAITFRQLIYEFYPKIEMSDKDGIKKLLHAEDPDSIKLGIELGLKSRFLFGYTNLGNIISKIKYKNFDLYIYRFILEILHYGY